MHLYKDGKKFTLLIDASALKKSSCYLRTFLITAKGYTTNLPVNNDTHFGSCFHLFRAEYRKYRNEFSALAPALKLWDETPMTIKPNKTYLTREFLMQVCLDYANYYLQDTLIPLKDGDTFLIEPKTKFAVPFISEPDIDVLIAGTQDEIAENKNNNVFSGGNSIDIVDAKSSSYWNTFKFFENFLHDPQLLLYRWTIKKYASYMPNSIWEWIDKQPRVSCTIDGVFYGKDKESKAKVEFKRQTYTYKSWQLEEFEHMLNKFCEEMIHHVRVYNKTGKLPPRFGILTNSCKDEYGPCQFCPACAALDDEQRDSFMELNFIERVYNPLTFGGIEK